MIVTINPHSGAPLLATLLPPLFGTRRCITRLISSLGCIKSDLCLHSHLPNSSLLRLRSTYPMTQLAGIQSKAVTRTTVPTMLSLRKSNTLLMLMSSMMSQKRSTTSWTVFSQCPWMRFNFNKFFVDKIKKYSHCYRSLGCMVSHRLICLQNRLVNMFR